MGGPMHIQAMTSFMASDEARARSDPSASATRRTKFSYQGNAKDETAIKTMIMSAAKKRNTIRHYRILKKTTGKQSPCSATNPPPHFSQNIRHRTLSRAKMRRFDPLSM